MPGQQAKRDSIAFVLSPTVHIRDPDLLTFFNPSFLAREKVPGPDTWKERDALKPRPAPSLELPAVAGRRAEAGETPPLPHTAWQTVAEPSYRLSAGHNKSPCPSASSPFPPPALFG